eukprot:83265-Amphidinium_carterae.1
MLYSKKDVEPFPDIQRLFSKRCDVLSVFESNIGGQAEGGLAIARSGPSGFSWQLRLRLWRLRARRKHLLRIVQAEDRLRRALATADDLESRGSVTKPVQAHCSKVTIESKVHLPLLPPG